MKKQKKKTKNSSSRVCVNALAYRVPFLNIRFEVSKVSDWLKYFEEYFCKNRTYKRPHWTRRTTSVRSRSVWTHTHAKHENGNNQYVCVCAPSMNEQKQHKTHTQRVSECYWRQRKRPNERTNEGKEDTQIITTTYEIRMRGVRIHITGAQLHYYYHKCLIAHFVTRRKIVIVVHQDPSTQAASARNTLPHRSTSLNAVAGSVPLANDAGYTIFSFTKYNTLNSIHAFKLETRDRCVCDEVVHRAIYL